MVSKKETTLDDLANMMGTGFRELNWRMGRFEGRMDNFEGRMNTLEEKVDIVNANVKSLGFDYEKVLARVRNLEMQTFGSVQE